MVSSSLSLKRCVSVLVELTARGSASNSTTSPIYYIHLNSNISGTRAERIKGQEGGAIIMNTSITRSDAVFPDSSIYI